MEWNRVDTWAQMGGVLTDTRGSGLKGVMDCRHHYRLLWATLPAAPLFHVEQSGGFEGLAFPFSLSSLCFRLGLRGLVSLSLRGPLFLWGAGIQFPWGLVRIRVSTYCETCPGSGIYMGSRGKTPKRNKQTKETR